MLSRYRGKVGQYLWHLDHQRMQRYKDRPWELQSRDANGSPVVIMVIVVAAAFGGLVLLSLF